jgi:hypothetical protein
MLWFSSILVAALKVVSPFLGPVGVKLISPAPLRGGHRLREAFDLGRRCGTGRREARS